MKKVYLVMFHNGEIGEYARHSIEGVCSTKEKAQEIVRMLTEKAHANMKRYNELCRLLEEQKISEAEKEEMRKLHNASHMVDMCFSSQWKYFISENTLSYYE